MTPEQLELVADTAVRIKKDAERFALTFYDCLFSQAPHVRELFPADLAGRRGKFVNELVFLAELARDFDGFVERALQLGARHGRYGVHADDYGVALTALMAALAATLGDDLNADVEAAWRRLSRLISETMMEGASGELFAES